MSEAPTQLHSRAAQAIAVAMAGLGAAYNGAFLRAVLDVAAGGITVSEGRREAAEALYRAGDAMTGDPP